MLSNRQQKEFYSWVGRLISGLSGGLIGGLVYGLIYSLYGLKLGLISGLIIGGIVLGKPGENGSITLVENFDLSFSRLSKNEFLMKLRYWLFFGLALAFISVIFGSLFFGLAISLFLGLGGGLITGLALGLIDGLKTDTDVRSRIEPNQGIFETAKNILPVSIIVYPFVLFFALGTQFIELKTQGLPSIELPRALLVSVAYALFFGAALAGWQACVQHFALRLVLYYNNVIPWNYARFLNHCTDRLLLQRVGGRYRFIHRLVQEHFAAMPLEK